MEPFPKINTVRKSLGGQMMSSVWDTYLEVFMGHSIWDSKKQLDTRV